jgi:hypothetical protein
MLTKEENEMLTRVGPGTPCGELMRRYWHPIAPTVQLEDNPVRKVRILGEDLVLFRDRSGNLGLIGPRWPHRAMHYVEAPIQDESGEYILDYVLGQDMVAWYEQGEITDRTQEHLYEGDKVIIAYRKMLKEQIEIVHGGGDPMIVIRDPAENVPWTPTLEGWPAATIEAATRRSLTQRHSATGYRFNFHKV